MDKKEYNRKIGAKRSQRNGKLFETLIERACTYYSRKGIAQIQKTPEPFQILRKTRNGQATGFYTKMAQPDFQGTLNGGQSIVFEAKHTEAKLFPFDRISSEQQLELEKHHNRGAKCFVILSFKFKNFYLIDWATWKDMKEHIGKKSVNEKDLQKRNVMQPELISGRLEFLKEAEL